MNKPSLERGRRVHAIEPIAGFGQDQRKGQKDMRELADLLSGAMMLVGVAAPVGAEEEQAPKDPSGTIEIDQTQMAMLGIHGDGPMCDGGPMDQLDCPWALLRVVLGSR